MAIINYRKLGNSGLKVSPVGLGTNNFGGRLDIEGSRKVIYKALDSGINFFDTADIYGNKGGSETILGEVLGVRRKDIILATKFGNQFDDEGKLKGASRHYIFSAIEASLKRLKTDWIDLYQIHRPDANTPIDETIRALDDLIRQGKVRYLGLSNFLPWQIVEAQLIAKELGANRFISSQDEYNLLKRNIEGDYTDVISAYGLGLLPYFPLASGVLSGKYQRDIAPPENSRLANNPRLSSRYLSDRNWQILAALDAFSKAHGHTLLELAFSWLLAKPFVSSVIAGASTAEQLEANINAANWVFTPEELAEIDRITAST